MKPLRILLRIPLSPYSGYGQDGIGMAQALVRAGHDVYVTNTGVQTPLPKDVALLLTKPIAGVFDLTIVHVDPMLIKDDLKPISRMLVGWTMWEFTSFGAMKGRSTLRKRLKQFDAMVGYDQVTADALREHYAGPILVQQGGYNSEDWQRVERDWHSPEFYFCMNGVLGIRKAPVVALQAFLQLQEEHADFAEHARLSFKTTPGSGLLPGIERVSPHIRSYHELWSAETLRTFYASNHCLLAPSRGEGKNLPAPEFMTTGGVVIATAWGGHRQWLNTEYAYPLRYELAPVHDNQPDGPRWAEPDLGHLKELMLHVFRNRSEARQKGQTAARMIPMQCDWSGVMLRLLEKLAER